MTSLAPHAPASVLAVLAMGRPTSAVVFAHADAVVQALRNRQEELHIKSQDIVDRAEAENHRDLSVEEGKELDALAVDFERVGDEIARRERIIAQASLLTTPQGRKTAPDAIPGDEDGNNDDVRPRASAAAAPPSPPSQRVSPQARIASGNGGFRNFGDFAQAVKVANPRFGGELDQRLVRNAAATTYSQEAVGADGGFAVPIDFRTEIMSKVFTEDSLIVRTDRLRSSSNTITMPIDMTTPWQTTGGVQAYWVGEAQVKTQSKIALEQVTVKLHQLATLVPVTEELLEDAAALDGYLRRKVPEKMDFKISHSIIWGSGAGQPLGFMASPAVVTQAAEAAQVADTIVPANLVKMLSRMPVASRRTAVWLIHPDAEPLLPLMVLGNQPLYLPAGGLSGAPFGTLFGRPVIPHQAAETIGDLGDVMLIDLGQYMSVVKTGNGRDGNGMRTDVSIHLWFDQDLVAYRFTIRLGGMPWWSAATPNRDGSNTQSPFVVLAAR